MGRGSHPHLTTLQGSWLGRESHLSHVGTSCHAALGAGVMDGTGQLIVAAALCGRPGTTGRPCPEAVASACAQNFRGIAVKWLPGLHDPGPPQLWRIGYALAACFVVALGGLAGLWLVALALLGHPRLPRSGVISLHDAVGVAQLVFASVAGAGALVALVMAYRRQRVAEAATALDKERWQAAAAHDRTQLLNERFTAIAGQLGDDQAAVRLAGVHAMAGLANDWMENRQTCVDVLCAYLRMPYEPDPGLGAPAAQRFAFQGNRQVRHTVIRVISAHLRRSAVVSWQGLNFDFSGVVFDGADFIDATFSGGSVSFYGSVFAGGDVNFYGAEFSGGRVNFYGAEFSGSQVNFAGASFSGGEVHLTEQNSRLGVLFSRLPGSPMVSSASLIRSFPAAKSPSPMRGSPAPRLLSPARSSPMGRSPLGAPNSPTER